MTDLQAQTTALIIDIFGLNRYQTKRYLMYVNGRAQFI